MNTNLLVGIIISTRKLFRGADYINCKTLRFIHVDKKPGLTNGEIERILIELIINHIYPLKKKKH